MANRSFLLLLCALSLLMPCVSLSAQPLVVTAHRAAAPPVLDGIFDDPTWQDGQWYGEFTLLGEGKRPATAQTRFKVAFDDAALYFAIEATEPHMDKLVGRETVRDGRVHVDDCVEIMLVPGSDRTEYYHFAVNVLGTQYDAHLRQSGHVRSVEWDCDWQAAIHKAEGMWTAEIAIPFVELGLTDTARDDWALNVARERQADTQELSSVTEGRAGFHQPELYATLQLPGAQLERYMWQVRSPFEVQLTMREGTLHYSAKTHITNHTGRFWFVELQPELVHGDVKSAGPPVHEGLDAGQGREMSFTVPVAAQGRQVLRLAVADRRNPAAALHIRAIPLDITYTPLALDVTRPHYRNSIYATQQIDSVAVTVISALAEEDLAGTNLRAGLYLRDAEGVAADRPTAESAPAPGEREVQLTIPAADLAVGDYDLTVHLRGADGAVVHSARTLLRKLPPAPHGHEWRFDERYALLHNGEPFMPFGWFSQNVNEFDASVFTAMQAYSYEYFPTEEIRSRLDRVAEKGGYITFSPYSREFMNRDTETEKVLNRPLNDDERQHLQRRVRDLMDHPALMAWYMFDEPELRPVLPQRARELHEEVAATDPWHPTIMLNDSIKGIFTYADGGDILMPDPYPLFLKGGLAASPIEKVSAFIKAVAEASGGRKACWVTPQAFNYGDYGRAGNRVPNLIELRNMLYQSVIYGAKGFLWYTYGQNHNYPELFIGMPFLALEARDLQDAILENNSDDSLRVSGMFADHIHTAVRRSGGHLTVFVVNTATEPQEIAIELENAPETLYVVSEGREIKPAGGRFTERFDIYATHIYSTDPALARRASLTDVRGEIDRANEARKKPGNLAFEDYGVEAVVSSGATYSNSPARVFDGILTHMGWRGRVSGGAGEWLEVRWPEPVTFGRVVVYSDTIASAQVQVPADGEGWTAVGTLQAAGDALEATFAAVTTDRLRIAVTALKPDSTFAGIQEVEVYAQ